MRGRVALAVAGACLLHAAAAGASGAIEAVAGQIAKGLGAAPGGAVVVSAPVASDVAPAKPEELAARVAQLVAGAIGSGSHAHAQTATLAQARAIASKGAALVFVQPEIAKGALRVTADVYAVQTNGWDRAREPAPPPRAHAFAQAPVDAEVRAFLPSIPLERAGVHKATHGEGEVLAAACGDLDGDEGMEIALVSRARVAVGHLVKGAFEAARVAPWGAIAAPLPVRMREPIGGASIVARDPDHAALLVATSDRAGVALDATLAPKAAIHGVPFAAPDAECAPLAPSANAFAGDVVGCDDGAPRGAAPAPSVDALAAADVVGVDGRVARVTAAHSPDGKLLARLGDRTASIDGAGAQIAVADLDQDGAPEIVASAADGEDAITIWSWTGAGDPRVRLKIPAPNGVRALGVCPPEERGAPALVAVVGGEVWIVR